MLSTKVLQKKNFIKRKKKILKNINLQSNILYEYIFIYVFFFIFHQKLQVHPILLNCNLLSLNIWSFDQEWPILKKAIMVLQMLKTIRRGYKPHNFSECSLYESLLNDQRFINKIFHFGKICLYWHFL